MLDHFDSIVLVLGGGNALGAYQGGGYAALAAAGVAPDWVVGSSTGAINGAIIAGNAPEHRIARLSDYWQPAASVESAFDWPGSEDLRRSAAVTAVMAGGQPNIFVPKFGALPWAIAGTPLGGPSVYDTHPLEATLTRLVDFDRLNGGPTRFTANTVDLETGEAVVFDTSDTRIEPRHIRASSALLPAFPPVEIDGRLLGDGGLSANLPVHAVLGSELAGPTLVIALDLLPLAARRPATLGEAVSRMQDLMFASQSRLSIAAWEALYAARGATPPVTLLHLSYDAQGAEVAGKAFDFSPRSVRARWDAGYADVTAALDALGGGAVGGGAGLTMWRPDRDAS